MKRFAPLAVALAIVLILFGCADPLGSGSQDTESLSEDAEPLVTPEDDVSYLARSADGEFSFQTVFSTDLAISVQGENEEGSAFTALDGAIVTAVGTEGALLFRGLTNEDGLVTGSVSLSGVPEDVTLRVEAEGFAGREVTIEEMVQYAEVSRTMYLERADFSAQIAGSVDSDGDTVPDVYDAFPDDPDAAFATDFPADGTYTVAYEDLYGRANAGDADYNDFVAHYSLTEETNEDGLITRITGEATAVAKMAGYTHRFGLFFRFDGEARLSIRYNTRQKEPGDKPIKEVVPDKGEKERKGGRYVQDQADVVLFPSTNPAVGRSSTFVLDFSENPQDPANINRAPYDPYLYVYNTGHDVHLIGEEPLPDSINAGDDDFRDAEGYPWALLVPADWEHPDERQRIDEAYPAFTYWRESAGEYYPDWYLYPGVDPGPPVENSAPYAVVAPGEDPGVREVTVPYRLESRVFEYQLEIALDDSGQRDPDGDRVQFRVVEGAAFLELNPDTGLVTLRNAAGDFTFEFYSEDDDGLSTRDDPLKVTFKDQSGT